MTKLKQVYFVYAIIVLIFIFYLIANIIRFINIHELHGYDYSLNSTYDIISLFGVFKYLPIFLIPAIAVFYKKRISWYIILSYLYFFIWQVFSYLMYNAEGLDSMSIYFIAVLVIILMIPGFSIFVMNKSSTFNNIYSLEREKLMANNMITFIIGFGLSLFLAVLNNKRYYEGLYF